MGFLEHGEYENFIPQKNEDGNAVEGDDSADSVYVPPER
jgi:hypothetical protein